MFVFLLARAWIQLRNLYIEFPDTFFSSYGMFPSFYQFETEKVLKFKDCRKQNGDSADFSGANSIKQLRNLSIHFQIAFYPTYSRIYQFKTEKVPKCKGCRKQNGDSAYWWGLGNSSETSILYKFQNAILSSRLPI